MGIKNTVIKSGLPIKCNRCRSENVVDIIYGHPSEKLEKAALEGKVKLGGCIIDFENPIYCCKTCNYQFGGYKKNKLKRFLEFFFKF
jgi:hypothetical protein